MSGVDLHQGSATKRLRSSAAPFYRPCAAPIQPPFAPTALKLLTGLSAAEDGGAVPPVTVVLEGRSICHRVSLDKHASYGSLAKALRRMFVDVEDDEDGELEIANAVPGHVVAYEDMEDDLLLAGDLNWKDFVRVTKRIRIVPAKSSRRRRAAEKRCGWCQL